MHANKPATERVSEWVSEWMVSIRLAQNQLLPEFVFFCRCSANFELQKEILQMGWNNVIMEDLFSLSWKSKCWICSIVSEWRYLLHKTRKICQFWYRIHISSYWQRFMRFFDFRVCVENTSPVFNCLPNERQRTAAVAWFMDGGRSLTYKRHDAIVNSLWYFTSNWHPSIDNAWIVSLLPWLMAAWDDGRWKI